MKDKRKAYIELLKVINKNKNEIEGYAKIREEAVNYFFKFNMFKKYKIDLSNTSIINRAWINIGDFVSIGSFGPSFGRKVSYPDNGKQITENIRLLKIGFPTGPFIFGADYPKELFNKFWNELLSYKPKYIDTVNRRLFFKLDNAGRIYNDLDKIIKNYKELYKKQTNKKKIKSLKLELEKLEGEENGKSINNQKK